MANNDDGANMAGAFETSDQLNTDITVDDTASQLADLAVETNSKKAKPFPFTSGSVPNSPNDVASTSLKRSVPETPPRQTSLSSDPLQAQLLRNPFMFGSPLNADNLAAAQFSDKSASSPFAWSSTKPFSVANSIKVDAKTNRTRKKKAEPAAFVFPLKVEGTTSQPQLHATTSPSHAASGVGDSQEGISGVKELQPSQRPTLNQV